MRECSVDLGLVRRSRDGYRALGILISNGIQKTFPESCRKAAFKITQIGWTKLPNAPFTFHLRIQHLETWNLAPEGTYDDTYDPLTGEVIPNDTWIWGDQFFRHLTGGDLEVGRVPARPCGVQPPTPKNATSTRPNRSQWVVSWLPRELPNGRLQRGQECVPLLWSIHTFGTRFEAPSTETTKQVRHTLIFNRVNLYSTCGEKPNQYRH